MADCTRATGTLALYAMLMRDRPPGRCTVWCEL